MNDSNWGFTTVIDEDFCVTAIGDLPEVDIQSATGVSTAIVAASGTEAEDGWVELPVAASDDDDVAALSGGALNVVCAQDVDFKARVRWSSVTDIRSFIGLGDSIASADESSFDAASGTVTIGDMSDAVGFFIDGDDSTVQFRCVSANTDVVVINQALGATYNPVAGTPITFGMHITAGATSVVFSINGKTVYTYTGTAAVSAAADLTPIVQNFEQGTANDLEVDRLFCRKGRGNG